MAAFVIIRENLSDSLVEKRGFMTTTKRASLLVGILFVLLTTLACSITLPGRDTAASISTSVAATVNALAGNILETEAPHGAPATEPPGEVLPTLAPPAEEVPLQVCFATPDGNLYSWAETMGDPQLIASDGDIFNCFVSSDGSLIAFSRYVDYAFVSLEVINADGSNRFTLLDAAQADAMPRPDGAVGSEPGQVGWIPNSHKLSVQIRHSFEGPGLVQNENFYVFDADTGGFEFLFSTGFSTWQFTWSPDGSKVAISDPEGVGIYDSSGAVIDDHILSYPFINTASEYAWTAEPIWSQDSGTVMVRVPPQDPFFSSGANSSLYRVTADGMTGEIIYETPMVYMMSGDTGISEDLTRIAYLVDTGSPSDNVSDLIASNVDGSDSDTFATGQFQVAPIWSPDNTHFFYSLGMLPDSIPYIGEFGDGSLEVMDYRNPVHAKWIDENRYLVVTNDDHRWRLLLGTVDSATGLIYDSLTPLEGQLMFSVNR